MRGGAAEKQARRVTFVRSRHLHCKRLDARRGLILRAGSGGYGQRLSGSKREAQHIGEQAAQQWHASSDADGQIRRSGRHPKTISLGKLDPQWRRGVWFYAVHWPGSYLIGSSAGAVKCRAVAHLPREPRFNDRRSTPRGNGWRPLARTESATRSECSCPRMTMGKCCGRGTSSGTDGIERNMVDVGIDMCVDFSTSHRINVAPETGYVVQ